MSQLALDLGVPSTLVTTAVYARCLSAMKDARVRASKILPAPKATHNASFDGAVKALVSDKKAFVEAVKQALYASRFARMPKGSCSFRKRARNTTGI